MLEDDLYQKIEPVLTSLRFREEPGEEFSKPALDVLKYYCRSVKIHALPLLGRGLSVVAVVRQPLDVGIERPGYRPLLERVALAVNSRFPPGRQAGLAAIGLTTIVITPEPIGPGDEARLKDALVRPTRTRVVPLGLIRVNLGQEAVAFQFQTGPQGLFPEPVALGDAFAQSFRQFVPLLET